MAHDVFVSYPTIDKKTADAVVHSLETAGIRCWIAPRDIAPGTEFATGIVAAQALSAALVSGEEGARERYLSFLGSGGSDYPLELLRGAGVDLESPHPYEAALQSVQRQLDVLEETL